MTPKKQRIAIAESRGWLPDDDGDGTGWKGSYIRERLIGKKPTFSQGRIESYTIEQTVPDYLKDLNAMQAAFKGMDPWLQLKFVETLLRVYRAKNPPKDGAAAVDMLLAPASDWAEAYLRTIDKWEED